MKLRRTLVLIIIFITLFSIGGVSAQWIYVDTTANLDISEDMEYVLSEYEFAPEEVLPDEGATLGENHYAIVNNVANHVNYGLNSDDKKSIIKRLIFQEGAKVVYSQQQVSGGNLKQMLVEDGSSEKVQFAVVYQDYDFLITYTFLDTYLNEEGVTNNTIIDVYKTEMIYDLNQEKWIATRSYLGTAPVKRVTASNKQIYSIAVDAWEIKTT